MVEGKREAIIVSTPEVYKPTDSDIVGDVVGASAHLLAKNVFEEVCKTFPSIPL